MAKKPAAISAKVVAPAPKPAPAKAKRAAPQRDMAKKEMAMEKKRESKPMARKKKIAMPSMSRARRSSPPRAKEMAKADMMQSSLMPMEEEKMVSRSMLAPSLDMDMDMSSMIAPSAGAMAYESLSLSPFDDEAYGDICIADDEDMAGQIDSSASTISELSESIVSSEELDDEDDESSDDGYAGDMMPVDEAPPLHASDMALGAPIDYTKLPGAIDSSIDKLLDGAPVRPTSLEVEGAWSKETSPYLLGARQTLSLDADALVDERNRAFDLVCLFFTLIF